MQIGAQMYTVRESCQTLDGFAETLSRIADIGYPVVQVSGTCPFPADWLKAQLERTGLKCALTHTPQARLLDEPENVIRDHDLFGCGRIGLGYWSFDPDSDMTYDRFIRLFPPVARKLLAGGKYFMFHNHDGEFRHLPDGRTVLEHLAEDVPADIMGFTLDTFWVQAGGADPARWLENLSGRIPCIHLKDYAYGRKMAVLGEGNINFDRVFEKAEAGETEYMLVEQDDCYGEDPMECLRRSYRYLRACGF